MPTPGSPPTPALIADAAGVVLPGVGAFGRCMDGAARRRARASPRSTRSASGRPFLGICIGMQMLFDGSEEAPGVRAASASSRARSAGSRAA